jgi:hypothetical protein
MHKRLAADILKCGQRKIWLDPNEMTDIKQANSRKFSVLVFSWSESDGFSLICLFYTDTIDVNRWISS